MVTPLESIIPTNQQLNHSTIQTLILTCIRLTFIIHLHTILISKSSTFWYISKKEIQNLLDVAQNRGPTLNCLIIPALFCLFAKVLATDVASFIY